MERLTTSASPRDMNSHCDFHRRTLIPSRECRKSFHADSYIHFHSSSRLRDIVVDLLCMLGSTIFQRSHSTKSTKSLSAKKRRSTICFDASYCFPPFATPSHLLTTKTPQIFHMWRDILLQREELFRSEPQRISLQTVQRAFVTRRGQEVAPVTISSALGVLTVCYSHSSHSSISSFVCSAS